MAEAKRTIQDRERACAKLLWASASRVIVYEKPLNLEKTTSMIWTVCLILSDPTFLEKESDSKKFNL